LITQASGLKASNSTQKSDYSLTMNQSIPSTYPASAENNQRLLLEAENNLRFSIGRYIHDNPQQQLQAALRLLREQAELIQTDPQAAQHQLAEINQSLMALLNQTDSQLSQLRRDVLPADARAGTLCMSIESYVLEDFPRLYPEATFEIKYDLEALAQAYDELPTGSNAHTDMAANQASEKMLFSLFVREGLRNAYKHSQASRVEVISEVVFCPGARGAYNFLGEPATPPAAGQYLRLTIKDNGCGFELSQLSYRALSGHRSFYDFETRVRMLGGFSHMRSQPGQGTSWELYLPLASAQAQKFNQVGAGCNAYTHCAD
jgi:signal transduction histidine kinase